MKFRGIYIFLLSIFLALSSFQPVIAATQINSESVEYILPYPGLLADHPLYFIKHTRDNIVLWMTRDYIKKSQTYLLISDKHLNMVKNLFELNKIDLALPYLIRGENLFAKGVASLETQKKSSSLPPGLLDKFELASKKHQLVIEGLRKQAGTKEQEDILRDSLIIRDQAYQKIRQLY